MDWGTALALFKEIQALNWLIFVTGADLLWLVSPKIQQPNKCCMTKTISAQSVVSPRIQQPNKCCMAKIVSAQSVQAQNSTRRTPFFGPKSLKYLEILLNSLSHIILFAFNYFLHSLLIWKLVHSKALYIVFSSFT